MIAQHMIARSIQRIINGEQLIKTGKVAVNKISKVNHKRQILSIKMLYALMELFLGRRIFSQSSIRSLAVLAIRDRTKENLYWVFFFSSASTDAHSAKNQELRTGVIRPRGWYDLCVP